MSFVSEPRGVDDQASYRYFPDGAIRISEGRIEALGSFAEIDRHGSAVTDYRPHLLMPGFIDAHTHFPQMQVIASWGEQLLDWLGKYTFPEERKFANPEHCRLFASYFFDELLRNGTTTAAVFGSVHRTSADAVFREASKRNLCMIAGKILMDRNAPEGLCDTPQSAYDDTTALIAAWHGVGRNHYAVTPRFAITSSPEQLEMVQALVRENPACYVQTHLSENRAEIELTAKLFPSARDYLDVYESFGLLGSRSLFGHAIHLGARERAAMAETGSVAVFCPTSNLFLGSGLFDEERLRQDGVRRAIATDVGGGTSYSMLRTLDEGYKVLQINGQNLDPLKAFYWATLGNARALSMEDGIGSLAVGSDADIVVLDSSATQAMALRMETAETLAEELFVLQTLGDDRSVVETLVSGAASRPPRHPSSGPAFPTA